MVGGFGRVVGEGVDLGEGVAFGGLKAAADGVVGDDGVGITEAGDVVGLGGGEEGNGVIAQLFGEVECREVRGLFFVENEVAMNLIGDEENVEFFAKGGELDHFALGENAAQWILRIGEKKDAGVGADVGDHLFPIESPDTFYLDVFDLHEFGFAIVVHPEKGRVDGRAGHHRLTRLGKGATSHGKGRNEASEMHDFFFLGGVANAVGEIFLQSGD